NVRIERGRINADPAFFSTRSGAFQVPQGLAFARVALSADASRVAAAAHPAQDPLVCVWDTKTGRLTHWLTADALEDAAGSLSFSPDARYQLTAGDSPSARLWDLAAVAGEVQHPAVTLRDSDPANVTVALFRPTDLHQVITGHSDGKVRLRNWRD